MPTTSAAPVVDATASARPPVKLFLASPPAGAGQRALDRLARFLDLDVFGESLLSRRARGDMRIQAVLLVIVFVFDLGVWSLMANLLFSKGASDIGWYTLPALLFGLATAIVVFAWERSFSTFDTRDRRGLWWLRWGGFALRGALILGAAFATAKPFELIVFRAPINERLYAESVRQQLVLQHLTISDLQSKVSELEERRKHVDQEAEQVLRGADAKIIEAIAALQRELGTVEREIQRLSGDIGTAEEEQRAPEAARWRGEREGLEGRRQALLTQIADYKGRISGTIIAARQRILDRLDTEIKSKNDEIREVQDGLAQIRSPRDREQGAARARANVAPADASVFRQLRIIDDLCAGAPPHWPEGNDAVIAQVRELYAVEDAAAPETRAYQVISWVAFTVGMVIPLMTLLFKLFMSSTDLATYYSLDAQWDAGNPDALQHATARRRADARRLEAA